MIEVTITKADGTTETREVPRGTKVADVVSAEGQDILINDELANPGETLRDGDSIEVQPRSGKVG